MSVGRSLSALAAALIITAAAYANWPGEPLPADSRIDSVLVLKGERKLILLNQDNPVKEYRIALGGNPTGHKKEEGDGKTPQGKYIIDYRKDNSAFHLALHISYPSQADQAQALLRGVKPGGLIMIHGIRNKLGFIGRWHRLFDWTNGCIAVTNEEIDEISLAVTDGTPIEIRP